MPAPLARAHRATPLASSLLSRLAFLLVVSTLGGLAACGSPLGSEAQLAGDWSTGPIPSGGSIALSIATDGFRVLGSGQERGIGPASALTNITIAGKHSGSSFLLTLTFDSGVVATYSGHIVDPNQLAGPFSVSGQPDGYLTLYRQ